MRTEKVGGRHSASAEGTKFSEDYGIFARMATSYFKPRETIRKSAHLGAPSLSLSPFGPVVLSHSHSAEDEDKTEMAPLKEPERAERTSKRTAFSAIHPPSLGMYRGRQKIVFSLWGELTQPRAHLLDPLCDSDVRVKPKPQKSRG